MSDPTTSARDSVRQMDHASLKFARWQGAAWAVMFGAGENSFGLFGAFLQAPPFFFGLLAGIPQLLGPLIQAGSANLMDRYPRRRTLVLISVLGHVGAYVPLALLAFAGNAWWVHGAVLVVLTLYFGFGHFGSPPWQSFISDLVPSSRRGVIFAQLGRIASVLTLVSMLATALTLFVGERYAPESMACFFAGIFALAGLARFVCFLCISHMAEPHYAPRPEASFTFLQFIARARESNFVRFVVFIALIHGTSNIAGPYFLPYCRYDLQLSNWQWICINSSATLATIFSLLLWGRFADRFGNKRVLGYSSLLIAVQPFWWMLGSDFAYLVCINSFAGVAWGGFNLATNNYIMEACSPPVRARCFAYCNMLLGLGVFCGSMVGGVLQRMLPKHLEIGGWSHDFSTPFIYLLILSAALRCAVALIFIPIFKELRDVHPFSIKDWFFQNVQFRMPVGIRLMPFGGGENDDSDDNRMREEDPPVPTHSPDPGNTVSPGKPGATPSADRRDA
jgi:MFS family permease